MTAANATAYFPSISQLVGNAGGAIQSLPTVTLNGGRERVLSATLAMAAQASGVTLGVCRIPLYSLISGITVVTDTSLGSATISLGDAANTTLYMAAQTLTTTNVPQRVGLAATHGQPIQTGYDCSTGATGR